MPPYLTNPGGENNTQRNIYSRKPNQMETASQICGIIAVISVFTMMIYPALVLGSLAIIFAILSRGSAKKLYDRAVTGIITGGIAIAVDIALLVASLAIIFSNGPMKQQLNDACKQMYGQTFDDMLQDAMDGELNLDYYNLPGM